MDIVIFVIIAFLASTAGAISGVGGGIIIKPVLDATNLMAPQTVNFLSGNTVLAMTIVSLTQNYFKKDAVIEWGRTLFLAIGAATGGVLGGSLFKLVQSQAGSQTMVKLVQSVLLLLLTAAVLIYVSTKEKIHAKNVRQPVFCILIGLTLGVVSAFLGIGGGPLNIAFLYYFFSMSPKTASINSLLIIFFSQMFNLGNTLLTQTIPPFNPLTLILMAVAGVIGALSGRHLSAKLKEKQVATFFKGFLILILLINAYNVVTQSLSLAGA